MVRVHRVVRLEGRTPLIFIEIPGTRPGTSMPAISWNAKQPPLLQMYAAPSGPIAAPFGPPPSLAMTCCLPSGMTRVSVSRAISTRITEPSGMAIGPSGNFRPEVISLCGVVIGVSPVIFP